MSEGIATRPPSIAEDIKQRKPFRTRIQEAYLGLVRAGDDLKRRTSAILEAAGVTLQQYNVLRILRGAGDDGLPTLTIAERMIERTPGVTRLTPRFVLVATLWVGCGGGPSTLTSPPGPAAGPILFQDRALLTPRCIPRAAGANWTPGCMNGYRP